MGAASHAYWRRQHQVLGVHEWSVADLGPEIAALVFSRGDTIRVIVSTLVDREQVRAVAVHALSHLDGQQGEQDGWAGWCEVAHCATAWHHLGCELAPQVADSA